MLLYKKSMALILSYATNEGGITLQDLKSQLNEDSLKQLIPSIEIFKEIMIELLQAKEIDLSAWKKERAENFMDQSFEFQLSTCLLDVIEENHTYHSLTKVQIYRSQEESTVTFEGAVDTEGRQKTIRCSNVLIKAS